VRTLISSLLAKKLQDHWELHEETPMANTGLRLSRVLDSAEHLDAPSQIITTERYVSVACRL
jgi:hypothetical protein